MSLCALHRYTVPLTGLGIAILYVVATTQYGIFHLLDYLILVGVSYYFLAVPMSGPRWLMSRYLVLYATTGLTLLWASIEKWGYASWTYPLLAREPDLLMGFEPRTTMTLAGFFEFNVTFMALSSASLLSRAVTLALFSIFLLAIVKFGDRCGRTFAHHCDPLCADRSWSDQGRYFLVLEQKSLWTEAYFMTGLYILAFVLVFYLLLRFSLSGLWELVRASSASSRRSVTTSGKPSAEAALVKDAPIDRSPAWGKEGKIRENKSAGRPCAMTHHRARIELLLPNLHDRLRGEPGPPSFHLIAANWARASINTWKESVRRRWHGKPTWCRRRACEVFFANIRKAGRVPRSAQQTSQDRSRHRRTVMPNGPTMALPAWQVRYAVRSQVSRLQRRPRPSPHTATCGFDGRPGTMRVRWPLQMY